MSRTRTRNRIGVGHRVGLTGGLASRLSPGPSFRLSPLRHSWHRPPATGVAIVRPMCYCRSMSRTLDTEMRISGLWRTMRESWPRSADPVVLEDLRRLGESGETWAAASLLALALTPDGPLATTAAEAIDRLLSPLSPAEWPAADVDLRRASVGWWLAP